jgi:predicted oxidoreductase
MKDRRRASRESMAWTLAFRQPEDHTPTHWLAATREAAMAAFAKSWRRE